MKGTNCNAGTNLTDYQRYFIRSINHMFNKKYLSSKYAGPSNIHKQLFPSELPTNLNNNAKLCFFTISADNQLIKYATKF